MFGALFFDRDPLRMQDLPAGVTSWLQDAGGFAAVGLVLWLLLGLPRWRAGGRARIPGWQSGLFMAATALAGVSYLIFFALFPFVAQAASEAGYLPGQQPSGGRLAAVQGAFLALAGACAIVAVALPFVRNLAQLRFRRI